MKQVRSHVGVEVLSSESFPYLQGTKSVGRSLKASYNYFMNYTFRNSNIKQRKYKAYFYQLKKNKTPSPVRQTLPGHDGLVQPNAVLSGR